MLGGGGGGGLWRLLKTPGSVNKTTPLSIQVVEGSGSSNMEGLMQHKVQQLKVKLEEREKVRMAVAKEQRKRSHSIRR